MPINIDYSSAAVMEEILPDMVAKDAADRVGLKLFPMVPKPTFNVRWIQKDNFYGLQQLRGMDGAPSKVTMTGSNTYLYEPGVYGEYVLINEREILTRAAPMNPQLPIPIGDLVANADALLINRELDGMEYNIWTLLGTGAINRTIPGPQGPVIWSDSYAIQTYSPLVPWSVAATSTPLANLQAVQQLSVGHGARFGADATMYMNQVTANRLINNENTADYGGRRNQYGATLNSVGAFNNYFAGQNLPQVVIVDDGFQPGQVNGPITISGRQYQKFIPDGTAILIGKRPGNSPVGETQMTLQAMQPGAGVGSGRYRFIKDYSRGINCELSVPPKIEVHAGYNGGLAIHYPSAVVAMTGL